MNQLRVWQFLIVSLGALLSAVEVSAAPACSYTGIFSTLAYDDNTGDFGGDEIIVTQSPQGYEVIYTESEGNFPIKPIVVDAKVVDGWLSFEVTVGKDLLKVRGQPSCKSFNAEYEWSTGSKYSLTLPRKKSFWDTSH